MEFSVVNSLVIFLMAGWFATSVLSFGKLSIKLLHFENPKGKLPNGVCCDGYRPGTTTCNGCEYYFIICISKPTGRPCSVKKIWTDELAYANYYVFPSSYYTIPDYDTVTNPMQLVFYSWTGSLSFKVSVFDNDRGNDEYGHPNNDVVSIMEQKNISLPASSEGHLVKKLVLLAGSPRDGVIPKMTMEVSVTCDAKYLIPACTDYCTNKDDDTGHYRCNYQNGTRDCLPGWQGKRCKDRIPACMARDDSLGHYSCDATAGRKICLPGWMDASTNCTRAIMVTSSQSYQPAGISTSQVYHAIPKTPQLSMTLKTMSSNAVPTPTSTEMATTPNSEQSVSTSAISGTSTQQYLSTKVAIIPASSQASSTGKNSAYQQINSISKSTSSNERVAISTPITATPVLPAKFFRQTFRVTLQGNGSKASNHSMAAAEMEICYSLRRSFFNANVTCIFSDARISSDAPPVSNDKSVSFKMANASYGAFMIDVTIYDKKDNSKKSNEAVEKAIWAANSNIKKKMALDIVGIIRQARTIESSYTVTGSMPTSSVVIDVVHKTKKKATFDVTRFGGFLFAVAVLVIVLFGILVAVTRKKRMRKVHPFKLDASCHAESDQIFSSRNSLKSIQSMQELIRKDKQHQYPNPATALEQNVGKGLHALENKPYKNKYQDSLLQPPTEYIKKKAVAL